MTAGDLVVYLADPLLYDGELRVLEVMDDMRILCEQVHYETGHEDEPAPRAIFEPHQIDTVEFWARRPVT